MKKKYSKPMVLIETFELNQSIALDCGQTGGGSTHYDATTCGFHYDSSTVVFTVGVVDACKFSGDDVGGIDEGDGALCYNTPTTAATVFSS